MLLKHPCPGCMVIGGTSIGFLLPQDFTKLYLRLDSTVGANTSV